MKGFKQTNAQFSYTDDWFQYFIQFITLNADQYRRKPNKRIKSERWGKPIHHQSMTICFSKTSTLKWVKLNAIMKSSGIHTFSIFIISYMLLTVLFLKIRCIVYVKLLFIGYCLCISLFSWNFIHVEEVIVLVLLEYN